MNIRLRLGLLLLAVAVGAMVSYALMDRGTDAAQAQGASSRILPFAPNLVEGLFALGYGDQIIAVPEYTIWPDAALALPRVGGILDPNLERIAALQPDLLLVQGENVELRRFATDNQIAHTEVKMDLDLASIWRGLAELDSLAGGDGSRSTALVDSLKQKLEEARNQRRPRRPRCLVVLGRPDGTPRDIFAPGQGSFLNELIDWTNAISWTADHPRAYVQLGPEALIADPPDLILEVRAGQAPRPTDDLRAEWDSIGLEGVRIEQLHFAGAMIPGPRIDQTLAEMVERIWYPVESDREP